MRWLLAAVLLAAGLAGVAPPAGAADPACPPAYGAATLVRDPHVAVVVPPAEPGVAWQFDCSYAVDGSEIAQAVALWYEPEGDRGVCGGFATDEYDGGGSLGRTDVDVGGSYLARAVAGGPTAEEMKELTLRLMEAVAPRAVACTPETPGCVVTGTVSDLDGNPVGRVRVTLTGPGLDTETATDADGQYRFAAYGGPGFDPATDSVQVGLRLEQPGEIVVHHGADTAQLLTTPFPVIGRTCRQDLSGPDGMAEAVPQEAARWRSLWVVFRRVQDSFRFATTSLGQALDQLPVDVYAWCDAAVHEHCAEGGAFRSGDSTLASSPQPGIYVSEAATAGITLVDDTLPHEFGHHVMGDAFSDETPLEPGRTAHGGYYLNASSNDSWVEGFATFFAAMVAKHGDRDGRLPGYRFRDGSVVELEPDVLAWDYEEFALAGLLLDVEDSSRDYLEHNPPVEPVDVVTKELTTPDGRTVVVGRIKRLASGSLALLHLTLKKGRATVRTLPIWIDGTDADLRSGDGVVFWAVVPPGTDHDRVVVSGLQERSNDDDPLDADLAELWPLLTSGTGERVVKPGKPLDYDHVFDVAELYGVLRKRYGAEVDQVFVAHGFFADEDGDRSYDEGEQVGLSSHPPVDDERRPTGPSVERSEPGHSPAELVTVDDGGADATYVVFRTYPEERRADSSSYAVRADAEGRIPVLVPPAGSGGTATVLALADGRLPEVVAELDGDDFWTRAAESPGAPVLTLGVLLEDGSVTLSDDEESTPLLLWVGMAALALAGAVLLGSLLSGRRS